MRERIRREVQHIVRTSRSLDRQTVSVLILCVLLVIIQFKVGSRFFFRSHIAADARELVSWAWWFGRQGILGFFIPVIILRGGFRCRSGDICLGSGDLILAV